MLRELPSLAPLAQVVSLRDAYMPENSFALNVNPLQPTTIDTITGSGDDLVPFQSLQDICASQT